MLNFGLIKPKPISNGYIYGLKCQNNGTNPAYQIDMGQGKCVDDGNIELIEVTSTITINIMQSGANGLDTGSESADTWYYIFIIKNPTTGSVAGLFSTSSTNPTMPSGYTRKRRIGSVRNDAGSNIMDFTQMGISNDRWTVYHNVDITNVLSGGADLIYTDVDCSSYVPSTSRFIEVKLYGSRASADYIVDAKVRENGQTYDYHLRLETYKGGTVQATLPVDANQVIEYKIQWSDAVLYINIAKYLEEL